jgi:hypothetical protein
MRHKKLASVGALAFVALFFVTALIVSCGSEPKAPAVSKSIPSAEQEPQKNQPSTEASAVALPDTPEENTGVPMDLKLNLAQVPAVAGQPGIIVAELTALADFQGIELALTLPDGTVLLSGETTWKGDVKRNEVKVLSIAFIIPDAAPRRFVAAAKMCYEDGSRLGKRAVLDVQAGIGKVQMKSGAQPTEVIDGHGKKVADFKQQLPK